VSTKTAIVTGAARGIGFTVAETLSAAGHQVILVDLNDAVDDAARRLGGIAVRADVAARSGREQVAAVADRVDVLVNNAGITRDALIANLDEAAFRSVVRVNLGAAHALATELASRMPAGAAIVNLSSRAQLGNVGQYNYAVSKAGVIGLTRALALQLAPRQIRVNAVAPGFIATDMTAAMPERVRDKIVGRVPLQRAGRPQDIAGAVAHLASEHSDYVTGQVHYVCGGRAYG
jgi:3-oxoacyl-[acyl-carrier protein] reductase